MGIKNAHEFFLPDQPIVVAFPRMYRLLFQSRTAPRAPVTNDGACLLIGRSAKCGLQLTEAGVCDQHAAIDRRTAGYFIRDLTHTNGVHVNGTAITDQRLTTGDEVELGSVRVIFEVVHEPPPERRAVDLWQFFGAGIVLLLIIGQLLLLAWIFAQPHPRQARTDIVARTPIPPAATPPVTTNLPALTPLTSGGTDPASTSEILSRMLKIVQVNRIAATTLRIFILARVGDRQLDPTAVTISVQPFHTLAQPGSLQWLPIPANWENFKSKEFSAHLPDPCLGYIVRTYYRHQPQDTLATPTTLLPSAQP